MQLEWTVVATTVTGRVGSSNKEISCSSPTEGSGFQNLRNGASSA
jgi:hypothetical protein